MRAVRRVSDGALCEVGAPEGNESWTWGWRFRVLEWRPLPLLPWIGVYRRTGEMWDTDEPEAFALLDRPVRRLCTRVRHGAREARWAEVARDLRAYAAGAHLTFISDAP